MSLYTKNGDNGLTNLLDTKNVSKSDDRIELIGTMEELISNIGIIKAGESMPLIYKVLEDIQNELMLIIRWVAKPFDKDLKLKTESITKLEEEISRVEEKYSIGSKENIVLGNNLKSAQADITRAIARRAERRVIDNDKKFGGDKNIKIYMNRISDYFYVLSRMYSMQNANSVVCKEIDVKGSKEEIINMNLIENAVMKTVLARIGQVDRVNLEIAKKLIDKIETYSLQKGINAVVAVCNPDGNMIAVHNMDGAFLASFDVAIKKAYTAVAVKMATIELGKLAIPGGTFYGVDKADNGRIIIIGGGVPLTLENRIIGGLGISGATGEQDHEIAMYGQQILSDLMQENINKTT
ncbi:MAG: cob(I)yrinic acid a,c-diamide adenosyltransferase [Lachnotalea sp.]